VFRSFSWLKRILSYEKRLVSILKEILFIGSERRAREEYIPFNRFPGENQGYKRSVVNFSNHALIPNLRGAVEGIFDWGESGIVSSKGLAGL